ncbi:MAG: 16S rRNA processing protein RimM [Kordiimonadaceae bacterium]|nr:16S rRNA processing protein RimM [Kordiimonadaceae bacterium]
MAEKRDIAGQTDRQQSGVQGDWICVGAFAGSHGVRGDVRLKSFTENPKAIFSYKEIHEGADGPLVSFTKVRQIKDGFVVRVEGVSSVDEAQLRKSIQLFVQRDSLADEAEDEFYLVDLIGLKALDETGTEIGFVRAVENFGAEDLLELVLDEPVKQFGRQVFVPFRKTLVPVVDIKAGSVTIAFAEWLKIHVSERDAEGVSAEDLNSDKSEGK